MPEGPEIKRVADLLSGALLGKRIDSVELCIERLRDFKQRITNAYITSVKARGKAMLIGFDNGLTMYSHNQLYGRWYICEHGEHPDTARQLRVGLHTASHSAWLYSASDVAILTKEELNQHPFLNRLGPDILDELVDWKTIARRLAQDDFRRRSLASLYLDQHFLAGLGNYLRSEILFFSRVPFDTCAMSLTRGQCSNLARNTVLISHRSYRTGGLTNPPATVARLRRTGLEWHQYRFAVFDREGLPCYACGTTIRRTEATSRRIYFCPECQTL